MLSFFLYLSCVLLGHVRLWVSVLSMAIQPTTCVDFLLHRPGVASSLSRKQMRVVGVGEL